MGIEKTEESPPRPLAAESISPGKDRWLVLKILCGVAVLYIIAVILLAGPLQQFPR